MNRDLGALDSGERPRKSRAKIFAGDDVSLVVASGRRFGFWQSCQNRTLICI